MQDISARHGLPYIMPSQAQKHVTHNEALRVLDALVQASVKSRDTSRAPEAPNEGDFYLIGENAQVEFAGYESAIAGYVDGAWMFISPVQGLVLNVEDEAVSLIFRGDEWEVFGAGGAIDFEMPSLTTLGINAQADTLNRFLLSAPASLFNHEGAGHQLKINKASESDTATVLFQSNFSGRAEMGLAGEDHFSFKVSANGSDFTEAMRIDKETAQVSFPATPSAPPPAFFNMFGDEGRFGAGSNPLGLTLPGGFKLPSYIYKFNGAALAEGDKYTRNSASFGGSGAQVALHLKDLVKKMKPGAPTAVLRYTPEFYTLSITAGGGVGGSLTVDGVIAYLAISGISYMISPQYTISYWARPKAGRCFIRRRVHSQLYFDGIEMDGDAELPLEVWTHVTRVVSIPPQSFYGYDPSIYQLHITHGGAVTLPPRLSFRRVPYPTLLSRWGLLARRRLYNQPLAQAVILFIPAHKSANAFAYLRLRLVACITA